MTITEYEKTSSWKYRDLVPRRYWRRTGLDTYPFRILEPWHWAYRYLRDGKGTIVLIPPAATCILQSSGEYIRLAVDSRQLPALAEAILQTGRLLFSSERVQKYFNLYKSYEALCPAPELEYAVVRHALSHAVSVLKRPKTIAALQSLFNTTAIDLQRSDHQRVFYAQFTKLMIVNDRLLAEAIERNLSKCIVLRTRDKLVPDWEVLASRLESGIRVD